MAWTTARISSSRWRPPGLGGGINSLIRSHSASVRSVGYGLAVIPPVYRTDATYGRLFKQPLRMFGDVVHLLIDVVEQGGDKIPCGHAVLLAGEGCHADKHGRVV